MTEKELKIHKMFSNVEKRGHIFQIAFQNWMILIHFFGPFSTNLFSPIAEL